MRTKKEGVQAANNAISSYKEQLGDLEEEQRKIHSNTSSIRQKINEIQVHLAQNILINISEEEVERASSELGLPTLQRRLEALVKQREENIQRKEEISNTNDFQNRELLIHPVTGEYSEKITELQGSLSALEQSLKRYNDLPEFKKLYNQKDKPAPTGIIKFFRVISLVQYFASQSYKRKKDRVLRELNKTTIDSVFYDYDEAVKAHSITENEYDRFVKLKEGVENLVVEYEELTNEIDNFEIFTLGKLQEEIVNHLNLITVNQEFREQVRKGLKLIVTSLIAQVEKLNYLEQMDNFITKEIADRNNRISSIGSVARKWKRKPYDRLRGDKTKWLIDVPKMKSTSTGKRLRWIRTMRTNIFEFEHYAAYDYMLEHNDNFLAWDVFARASEEQMPYEGFTSQVILDISQYREEFQQEKANYEYIDLAIVEGDGSSEGEGSEGRDMGDVVVEAAAVAVVATELNEVIEAEEGLNEEESDAEVDIADQS